MHEAESMVLNVRFIASPWIRRATKSKRNSQDLIKNVDWISNYFNNIHHHSLWGN